MWALSGTTLKLSLRHVQDFSRIAVVTNPDLHHLWSSLVAPFMHCEVELFSRRDGSRARLADVARGRRGLITARLCRFGLLLNRFQVIDDRLDVGRAEHEDGHVGMTRDDSLREGFGEVLNWIAAR